MNLHEKRQCRQHGRLCHRRHYCTIIHFTTIVVVDQNRTTCPLRELLREENTSDTRWTRSADRRTVSRGSPYVKKPVAVFLAVTRPTWNRLVVDDNTTG
jgi:hypothetical protein